MATHDRVLAPLANEAVFTPVVGSAVHVIDHEIGQRKARSTGGEVKHAVEVDPLAGDLPGLAAIRDPDSGVDSCLLQLSEVFTGHDDDRHVASPHHGARVAVWTPTVEPAPDIPASTIGGG